MRRETDHPGEKSRLHIECPADPQAEMKRMTTPRLKTVPQFRQIPEGSSFQEAPEAETPSQPLSFFSIAFVTPVKGPARVNAMRTRTQAHQPGAPVVPVERKSLFSASGRAQAEDERGLGHSSSASPSQQPEDDDRKRSRMYSFSA